MADSWSSEVVVAVGTLLGAGVGVGYAYQADRLRAADAKRYRSHELRATAAADFVERFNAYRRDVRLRGDSADSGPDLQDVMGRVKLFFDKGVVERAERAQCTVNEAKEAEDEEARKQLLTRAETERDVAIDAMRHRLE